MKSSKEVDTTLEQASKLAASHGHAYITTEHFLLAMIKNKDFAQLLLDFGVQLQALKEDLEDHITTRYKEVGGSAGSTKKTQALERVFNRAFTSTLFSGRETLQLIDIFLSIMAENNATSSYFLMKYNIQKDEFVNFVKQNERHAALNEQQEKYLEGIVNSAAKTLTEQAEQEKLDPVIGRDDIINDICQTFARRNKSNVLMVGDPGVGKTAVAEGLAVRIAANTVPDYLKDHTVYNLDVATMLAGTQYRGQFEERVKETLDALVQRGNNILFIDEAHTLKGAGAGGQGGTDFANILKPYLGRGKLVLPAQHGKNTTRALKKIVR